MKPLSLLLFAVCLVLSDAAFARGGMGSHMSMSMTGGALGTSVAAPGTNSLGTALPSGIGGHVMKGPLLGTDPTIDKEDARLQKMLEGSICRGC
jgi:hypothetical protein